MSVGFRGTHRWIGECHRELLACSISFKQAVKRTTEPKVWFPRQHFLANFLSAATRSAFVYSCCNRLLSAQIRTISFTTLSHTPSSAGLGMRRSGLHLGRVTPRKGRKWFWAVSSEQCFVRKLGQTRIAVRFKFWFLDLVKRCQAQLSPGFLQALAQPMSLWDSETLNDRI